ncbi:SusC/RagA family TonB-linked outer membrane protein [Sphingobacterium sp. CZ-UAM]|uniref:SusC/RagA family TonB-linked outer membrane protein n=1 Tax=Sphingobacterium sp. CZ-UAM TaxID=1933868 RepID=UPI00158BFC57|nr:TonB-dependent receptor [Sphingobacterium sp. CZ-UAM]
MCLLLIAFGVKAQNRQIKGIVKDDKGLPIENINVQIQGKKGGIHTNASGNFSIEATATDVLAFSAVGYQTRTVPVNSIQVPFVVVMPSQSIAIEDVVVIGYGTQRRKDLTASISSVTAKDFREQPVVNISQAMQGRVPGVQVTSNAGAPGGAIAVRIRGNNSIRGDNNPLYIIDGFVGADPNSINPNDIETIDVLKDASATAIYGSRGANGVVAITTKKGKAGKTTIDLLSQFTSARRLKKLDLLNAADFATIVNEKNKALEANPIFTQAQIEQYRAKGGTDWQDEIFRTAPTQEYQLNISGGNDKTTYYTSGNYLNQQGIIHNSWLKRYALRASIDAKLYPGLSFYVNAYANRNESNNTSITGRDSPIAQAIAWSPTETVRDASGGFTMNDPYSSITFNPVAIAKDQNNRNNNSVFSTLAGLRYQIIPGLSLDVSGAINYNNNNQLGYRGIYIASDRKASASRSNIESIGLQNTNNLTYSRLFNQEHQVTVTAVLEYQSFKSTGFNANAGGLFFPALGYYNLAQAQSNALGTSYSDYQLLSYLGRASYDYKGRYYITASVRRDGSSKFHPGNQYSTFPSASVAWKISEMDFMKENKLFDNFKLRAGYGVTGNQAIGPYSTIPLYQNVTTFFAGNASSTGIIPGEPKDPDLGWERTTQWDIGLDADMFDHRLSFSADYYSKNTDRLLLPVPVPMYMGGGAILKNVGEVNNRGVDLSLSGNILQNGKVTWNSAFNVSFLRNKVVALSSAASIAAGGNVGAGLSSQPEFKIIPGQPMGSYWGLTYLGTWKPAEIATATTYGNVPGDARYADLDDNKVIDGNDFHQIGNGLPRYAWGWNNTVNWKGFTFNVFVQALGGFDKLNYTYAAGITGNADFRQATFAEIKNRYIPGVNETSDIPAFSKTSKLYTVSTRFLEDGSFVRFKNISLSYELPRSLIGWAKIALFVRGTNLFTITRYKGFDPESNNTSGAAGTDTNQSIDYGSYPNAKSITGGMKINF